MPNMWAQRREMEVEFISGTKNPRELCVACARVAYQSQSLASPSGDAKLLKFLISRGHRSITEFARVTFLLTCEPSEILEFISNTKGWELSVISDKKYVLTVNPRTIYDGLQRTSFARHLLQNIPQEYVDLIVIPEGREIALKEVSFPDTGTVDVWDEYIPLLSTAADIEKHSFRVLRITASRGLMDELFRHRLGAMVGSSTRRVDFSGFEYNLPDEYKADEKKLLSSARKLYKKIKETHGLDVARNLLPLGMKCSFVYGTSISHWKYIQNLRSSKEAHPEFKEVLWTQ